MTRQQKIFFFFNQLLEDNLYTGGEIRGAELLKLYKTDPRLKTIVICPKISTKIFPDTDILQTGRFLPEYKFNRQNLVITIILFVFRTIESLVHIPKFKNNVLYSTGDFFCNVIPPFITKVFYPDTRWVAVVHHINPNPFNRKNVFVNSLFSYLLQRISLLMIQSKSDIVFTVNQQVKQYLQLQNNQSKIHAVGNGLDLKTMLSDIHKLGRISPGNQICYFGRLSPTKGVLDLPEIFSLFLKHNPQYTLHLIGYADKPFIQLLKDKFKKYNCLDKVIFHGFVQNRLDIYKTILNSRVCLFPTYEEGWGIALFEAVICRRPVISYNLPIFTELFGNKLTTVKVGDIAAFAKKLDLLVNQKNDLLIDELFKVAQKYDWQNVYKKEKLYIRELL